MGSEPQAQKSYRGYTLHATEYPDKNEWNVEAYAPGWRKVGDAEFAGVYEYDDDGSHLVALKGWNVDVHPDHRRKGLASAMYCFAEESFGLPIYPGDVQTPEGAAFVGGRNCSDLKTQNAESSFAKPVFEVSQKELQSILKSYDKYGGAKIAEIVHSASPGIDLRGGGAYPELLRFAELYDLPDLERRLREIAVEDLDGLWRLKNTKLKAKLLR